MKTSLLKVLVFFLVWLAGSEMASARKVYSAGNGDWSTAASWNLGVPVNGDTVIIQSGHTITVTANLYSTSISMFVVVVGTLDLGNNGKLSYNNTSTVIVETGGSILGTSNGAQISFGGGAAEYRGNFQGTITGPAYVSNNHNPTSNEGTGGCMIGGVPCYTPGTIPLPIKLSSFLVSVNDDIVVLKWTTVMEKNFDKFVIERSSTGTDFESIADVKGKGADDLSIEHKYQHDDISPLLGFNYYRLKAIDLDGNYEYFGVRVAKLAGPKELSVYPNPASGSSISFSINFNPSENDRVLLNNSMGTAVLTTGINETTNQLNFQNKLSDGVYLLKYISNDLQLTTKVLIRD